VKLNETKPGKTGFVDLIVCVKSTSIKLDMNSKLKRMKRRYKYFIDLRNYAFTLDISRWMKTKNYTHDIYFYGTMKLPTEKLILIDINVIIDCRHKSLSSTFF